MDTNNQIKTSSNSPKVSILMLTYNRAHFLSDAIASVINQTYQNWELIIIDDGSTDNTEAVVSSFIDERIRYIKHETNAGLHPRRRESLAYMTGKYVAVLDSDDTWISPEKLSLQVSELEADQDLVLVGTQTKLLNDSGAIIGDYHYHTSDKEIRKHILKRNQFTHSAVLIRTEALKKTTGYQPILAEDLELFLQLGNFGKFLNLNIFGTGHRVHPNSQNDHGIKMSSAVHQIIQKHRAEYPNYLRALAFSYLRLIKYNLTKIFS